MILSDVEIKNGLNYHSQWFWLGKGKEILAKSHFEANARIRELEAKLRELIEILEAADEKISHSVDEYTGEHLPGCLSCRILAALDSASKYLFDIAETEYQAALKAAKRREDEWLK
jgi:hypothetical protein